MAQGHTPFSTPSQASRLARALHAFFRSPAATYLLWLLVLLTVGAVVASITNCYGAGCSTGGDTLQIAGRELDLAPSVRATASGSKASIWLEFGATGVFTPTTTASGLSLLSPTGSISPQLDELAEKGFVAIRVPHAPPTYTASSLIPGIEPWDPHAAIFSYYSPPTNTTATTVAVSVTRRTEYESLVNQRFPISDGRSHWEVWWLPQGASFPIPNEPFRVDGTSGPPTVGIRLQIDFGDAGAKACAGCPVQILAYNGYVFIGPFDYALRYTFPSPLPREPLVSFGAHCAYQSPPLQPSLALNITPTVPFTHTYCLENWDSVTRTFTITASSSQGWDYAYYYLPLGGGSRPIQVSAPPFTVTVGPLDSMEPGLLGLLARGAPTITISDTMREELHLTATSIVSSDVKAASVSMAFAPNYQLDETGGGGGFRVYLPLLLKGP